MVFPLVTKTILDPTGEPIDDVAVTITLTGSDGNAFTGSEGIAGTVTAHTGLDGKWEVPLCPNQGIQPAGTYYLVEETHQPSGMRTQYRIEVPTGPGPYTVAAILSTTMPDPVPLAIATTQKGVAGGVATLDDAGQVPVNQLANAVGGGSGSGSPIPRAEKGAPGGVATLDIHGWVPVEQLGNLPPSSGGSAGVPLFDVTAYGAVGDGVTDDSAAFAAAFAALFATGKSGFVYTPYTDANRYLCPAAPGDDAGAHTYNATIKIPYRDSLDSPMVTWGIIGPADAVALVGRKWPGDGQQTRQGQGGAPVLLIDYDTPYGWDSILGHPSWIGAPHGAPTNVHWYSRGLVFRQPDNPSLAALDLYGLEAATVDQLYFDTAAAPDATSEPTHPTGTGIIWPHNANSAVLTAGKVGIWGHFAGIGPAEHLSTDYVYSVRCKIAHPVREGIGHACHFGPTVTEECTFPIAGYDPSNPTGIVPVPDHCIWRIDLLDIEDFQPDGAAWAYCPDHGSHIYDPNNNLQGVCWYLRHNSGGSGSVGDTSELTGKGGGRMVFRSLIDADTRHTVTQNGHDPEPSGATVPGVPTIGAATPGVQSASVAFTPPAGNGGAPITSYVATSTPGGLTGSAAGSPITVRGLTAGTAYTFTVHAVNAIGDGPESDPSNPATPTAPVGHQTLFGNATPAVLDAVEGGGVCVGTVIKVRVPGNAVTHRWRTPNTETVPAQDIQYALYRYNPANHGNAGVLATGVFAAGGTLPLNQWVEIDLPEPVHLDAGDEVVAVIGPTFEYTATPECFTTEVINGDLSARASTEANPNGVFAAGFALTFPTQSYAESGYYVDFGFVAD